MPIVFDKLLGRPLMHEHESSGVVVSDVAYDATSWNGNLDAPTKNAIRDKIETMGGSGLSQAQVLARLSIGF